LPGVTRASILELAAKELGFETREEKLTLAEMKNAKEAFCCGTGACITPVGSVSVFNNNHNSPKSDEELVYGDGVTPGPITEKLYHMLTGIQTGSNAELAKKYKEWIHVVQPR